MKILVVGNGGREHAIARTLLRDPAITQVLCVPGNGGTATTPGCHNVAMGMKDFDGLARLALTNGVGFVVIGPEDPLAAGITDALRSQGIPVFGPSQAGAQLEASKNWAKELMAEAGIPTAKAASFDELDGAIAYLEEQGAPIVIKADGLAAGKGVTVAMDLDTAKAAVNEIFGGKFGAAGSSVLIEEFMDGREASVLAFTDGKTIRPLVAAQDHKRVGEGDTGPNTGGMGAYAPAPLVTPALMETVQTQILEPVIQTLAQRNIDYCGIVYAGLMITPDGTAKVVEFNCRFGDPETQVVLPLLDTPLHKIMQACIEGKLADLAPFEWKSGCAGCVVAASGGYPGAYEKGKAISGLGQAETETTQVFQAGTKCVNTAGGQTVVTDGGRVLAVTGIGETFDEAFAAAYGSLGAIAFEGAYHRRDIGYQVRSTTDIGSDHAGVAEQD